MLQLLKWGWILPPLWCSHSLGSILSVAIVGGNQCLGEGCVHMWLCCSCENLPNFDLFMMYSDPTTSYQCEHFQLFCDVVENNATTITQDWVIDLNNCLKSLSFQMANHSYQIHIYNVVAGIDQNVYKNIFLTSIGQVKPNILLQLICLWQNWIDILQILSWWMLLALCIHIFGCSLMLIMPSPSIFWS